MSRPKKYIIDLSESDRNKLLSLIHNAKTRKAIIRFFQIFPELDCNNANHLTQEQIYKTFGVRKATVSNIVKAYADNGLDDTITYHRNPNSNAKRKVDGRAEAHIIELACSAPPEGYSRWSIRLLADYSRLVLDTPVSRSTIQSVLKKQNLTEYWCIPPKENAAFVACMEDVLDIYELPYNPDIPVVCMDEKPYQLLDETRQPLPLRPGDIPKMDSEYIRKGTSSIFVFTDVLASWRYVSARAHRATLDWAEAICFLLEECYPEKETVILVMDNLNTHAISSIYKRFPPAKARSLAKRLEIYYTPVHGSWLNIA